VAISGIQNTWEMEDLDNFAYLLRACSNSIPDWLKFVVSIHREDGNSAEVNKIIDVLATQSVLSIPGDSNSELSQNLKETMV
jgi:hypothetical protein